MHPNPYTVLTYPKDYSPALDNMFKAFFISSLYIFPLHKGGVEMWETTDNTCMGLALSLAANGEGRVNPNPLVGAVIVRAMLPSWQNPALHGCHHKKRHPPGGHRRQ